MPNEKFTLHQLTRYMKWIKKRNNFAINNKLLKMEVQMKLRLNYNPLKNWDLTISQNKPEVLCISGPYLDQLIFREVRNQTLQEIVNCSWSDHHHSHSTVYRSKIDLKKIVELIKDLKEEHNFKLSEDYKFRQEKNGIIVPQGRNAYFINNLGVKFIDELKEKIINLKDLRKVCDKLNIAILEGFDFFKMLVIFQIIEYLPAHSNNN